VTPVWHTRPLCAVCRVPDAILTGRDSLEADSMRQIFFILKEFWAESRLTSNSLKLATV
jgi:hypothetical protein